MPNPNNPAQDTYNPPKLGSDWIEDEFSEINPGEIFRLKQNFNEAAELILLDKKHLDNNPKIVQKNDIIDLLKQLNESDGVSDL